MWEKCVEKAPGCLGALCTGNVSGGPWVNVGRGFVDDENAILPQDCSGQAQQLPLAHAEVGA